MLDKMATNQVAIPPLACGRKGSYPWAVGLEYREQNLLPSMQEAGCKEYPVHTMYVAPSLTYPKGVTNIIPYHN